MSSLMSSIHHFDQFMNRPELWAGSIVVVGPGIDGFRVVYSERWVSAPFQFLAEFKNRL